MSTLLAIGDSHTFGSEIYGEGDNRPESIYKAYPEKLRQLLEIDECVNLGQPGASIMRTERLLVEYLADNPKPDLIILGWTCLGRYEYADGFDDDGSYHYNLVNSWRAPEMTEGTERYKTHIQFLPICLAEDLLAQKYRTMYICENICKNNNIPYLMFDVMTNTKDEAPLEGEDVKFWSGDHPVDKSLYKAIDKNNYMETSYWDWIMKGTFPEVRINGGHANEAGHERWAQKLVEELKERNIYGV